MRFFFILTLLLCSCSSVKRDETRASEVNTYSEIRTLAFGSCADHNQAQEIWDSIAKKKPDLFLFIGDSIYPPIESLESIQSAYAALEKKEHFKRFRRQVPVQAVWDDHDYGKNDGGVVPVLHCELQCSVGFSIIYSVR